MQVSIRNKQNVNNMFVYVPIYMYPIWAYIRFGDDSERSQAMTEMNGDYCLSRPMRIGAATPRQSSGYNQHGTKFFYLLPTLDYKYCALVF